MAAIWRLQLFCIILSSPILLYYPLDFGASEKIQVSEHRKKHFASVVLSIIPSNFMGVHFSLYFNRFGIESS